MRSRKAYPLKLLPSIESEAEPAKLPLFEGKQLFCCLSLRVLGKCQQALGFYRKAKSFGKIGKEREKNLKKHLSRRKGCL